MYYYDDNYDNADREHNWMALAAVLASPPDPSALHIVIVLNHYDPPLKWRRPVVVVGVTGH